MKIYFYYKDFIIADNHFKLDLINCASDVFHVLKGNIIICDLIKTESLFINGKNCDYFCVVDDTINDLNLYKNKFNEKLNELTSKSFNISLIGDSLVTKNFDKKMFEKNIKFNNENDDYNYKARALNFVPTNPYYTFDRVILAQETIDKILEAINTIKYENKIFNEWGLKAIKPNPSSSLSFFGPSGTGKTMAAEAVASFLGKKILKVGYADIESKYYGEGPKMIKAIFMAAEKNDCVLFIDEADSLLSKRLTNVTQGSEQAINSLRSQLLICLEEFKGIVIFATNLVMNYDNAFLTRLISIEFKKPNEELREKIWRVHLYPCNNNGLNIPLSNDVDVCKLAKEYEFCGRDIRKAVISACVKTIMKNDNFVNMENLIDACEQIKKEEISLKKDTAISACNDFVMQKEKINNKI